MKDYKIEHVFVIPQYVSDSGRFTPMALSSIVSDRKKVGDLLNICIHASDNETMCAQKILDDFTEIYQTYVEDRRGPYTTQMVKINGELEYLELDDPKVKRPFVGNVLPLSPNFYLANDWIRGTVTSYYANYHDIQRGERLRILGRGRTVKLPSNFDFAGITRIKHKLVVVNKAWISIYNLTDVLFSRDFNQEITLKLQGKPTKFKCNGDVEINEIEYNPFSGKLWAVPINSSRIIEFDPDSYNCIGDIKFDEALGEYSESIMNNIRNLCKFKPDFKNLKELTTDSVKAVVGINFIAKDWLIVSPWNSSRRYIVKIKQQCEQ